jgi:hypothetical protein
MTLLSLYFNPHIGTVYYIPGVNYKYQLICIRSKIKKKKLKTSKKKKSNNLITQFECVTETSSIYF